MNEKPKTKLPRRPDGSVDWEATDKFTDAELLACAEEIEAEKPLEVEEE